MALTLETINKGREAMGYPPLDKLPETKGAGGDGGSGEGGGEGSGENKDKPNTDPANQPAGELSETAVMEFLKEKYGLPISSLEELKQKPNEPQKTPEELELERENKKLSYALEKGLFSAKDHEKFIADSQDKTDLVFAEFVAEARAEDPTISDEDLQEEFAAKYGVGESQDSRKYKRGQQEISMRAEQILKNRHKKIYDAERDFSNYENSQRAEADRKKTIKEKAPLFIKDITEIASNLKTVKVKVSDDETSEVEITPEIINKVKDQFLSEKVVNQYAQEGWTKEQMSDILFMAALRLDYNNIINKEADARVARKQAGARGIIDGGKRTGGGDKKLNLTPEQQIMYDTYSLSGVKAN